MKYVRDDNREWSLGSALALDATTGQWAAAGGGSSDCAAVLVPRRSEVILTVPLWEPWRVNSSPVRGGLHVMRAGDRLSLDDSGLVFQVVDRLEARSGEAGESEGGAVCPVCKAPIRPGDRFAECGHCGTPHHLRCLVARRSRCGVYGCLAVTPVTAGDGGGGLE